MDYTRSTLGRYCIITAALLFLLIPGQSRAQSEKGYEILPAPDVWYNSVDGIRVGVRLRGQTPGTFGTGPHRIDAGLWLGTNIPTYPVSYYFSLTEPIPSISDFGSEANVRLETSYRTGFQSHGLTFNKRWQAGFDETNYTEFSVGMRAEHRFEKEYLLYNQLWQSEWLYPVELSLLKTNENGLGRYRLLASANAHFLGDQEGFLAGSAEYHQRILFSESVSLFGRLYTGMATANTAPEYLFARSFNSPRRWMDKGLTRARGTIPPSLMRTGGVQVAGGANLRGYLHQDTEILNNGSAPLYTSLSSLNAELNYPNPLGRAINRIPILGEFMDLRSYVFLDAGTSLGLTEREESQILADAGPGFMLGINIPDYLGKSRGLMIRYDLPLWLSHPGMENHFKFRNVIGIGTVISF